MKTSSLWLLVSSTLSSPALAAWTDLYTGSGPDGALTASEAVLLHERLYGNATKYTPMSLYEGLLPDFSSQELEAVGGGTILPPEEALEWYEGLYGSNVNGTNATLTTRDLINNRYVFAATLEGLAVTGWALLAGPTVYEDVANACYAPGTSSIALCIGHVQYQVALFTLSETISYVGLASASSLVQGYQNWSNSFGGVSGLDPEPTNSRRRSKRQLCPSTNVKHDVSLGSYNVAFNSPHIGVKASCTTPCYNNPTFDESTISWLVSQAADIMTTHQSSEMQFTLWFPATKKVWARCHVEEEVDFVDTCPNGIDGGSGCVYQGGPA